MAWLGKGVDPDDFEAFRSEVNGKLKQLSDDVMRRVSDDEALVHAAAQSSSASEARIKAIESAVNSALGDLETYRDQALEELRALQKQVASGTEDKNTLEAAIERASQLCDQVIASKAQIDEYVASITQGHAQLDAALAEAEKIHGAVDATTEIEAKAKQLSDSLQSLLSHSMKRKADIDTLRDDILGYDVSSADGATEHVDGLKDELVKSCEAVAAQTRALASDIEKTKRQVIDAHGEQLARDEEAFATLISDSKGEFAAVSKELKNLLPGAMATGLSAAYDEKKVNEEGLLTRHEKIFERAIVGLVVVSCVPFSIDAYRLMWEGASLAQVLRDSPGLMLLVLPLYFPVLWLAYSANKRLNLSKRLIEEYTHKSVLGKTFSGLSNQIDALPHEGAVKEELRTRLLFNVLQVSAENPGKLITDYQKSDHPLMDAMEKSAKLSESMGALARIPGITAIAKKVAELNEGSRKAQQDKVEAGLEVQETLEEVRVGKSSQG